MGNKKTPRLYKLHKHGYFLNTQMTDSDLPDLPENSRTVRRLKKKEQRKNKRR